MLPFRLPTACFQCHGRRLKGAVGLGRLLLPAILWLGGLALPAQAGPAGRRLAITFDDLPLAAADACDADLRTAVQAGLLGTLQRHGIRAAGFVNEGRGCGSAVVSGTIEAWLDGGHTLGNHTHSHPDLNRVPLVRYTDDILKGEALTRPLLARRGQRLRYFRHPFLHAGATAEAKQGLADFLAAHGYEVAAVTFDNQEWVFAHAYQRAHTARNAPLKRRIAQAYLAHMEEVTAFFEERSRAVLGREPAQTLLLHANLLNADHLDALIGMFRRRGYGFVTLAEAQADPAYGIADGYTGPKGLSWIHRWGLTKGMPVVEEPREPEWVAKLAAGGG